MRSSRFFSVVCKTISFSDPTGMIFDFFFFLQWWSRMCGILFFLMSSFPTKEYENVRKRQIGMFTCCTFCIPAFSGDALPTPKQVIFPLFIVKIAMSPQILINYIWENWLNSCTTVVKWSFFISSHKKLIFVIVVQEETRSSCVKFMVLGVRRS